jgi:hypothetical protein
MLSSKANRTVVIRSSCVTSVLGTIAVNDTPVLMAIAADVSLYDRRDVFPAQQRFNQEEESTVWEVSTFLDWACLPCNSSHARQQCSSCG